MANHKCGCNRSNCLICKNKKTCNPCKPKKIIINNFSDFLLKFSGITPSSSEGATIFSFLADNGNGVGIDIVLNSPSYVVGLGKLNIKNLTCNLQTIVPNGATFKLSLLKKGVIVPNMELIYLSGESGIKKSTPALPILYETDDIFDLQMQTTGILPFTLNVSATLIANLNQ